MISGSTKISYNSLMYMQHPVIKLFSILLFFILIGCRSENRTAPIAVSNSSSYPSSVRPFVSRDIGAHSNLEKPKDINIFSSSRFVTAQEPTFNQVIGHEINFLNFEEFCSTKKMSMSFIKGIVIDCKIINTISPHTEFYFAHFNLSGKFPALRERCYL